MGVLCGRFVPRDAGTKQGYHQVGMDRSYSHKYIEESGTMNIFFNIDGTLVTPALDGTNTSAALRGTVSLGSQRMKE